MFTDRDQRLSCGSDWDSWDITLDYRLHIFLGGSIVVRVRSWFPLRCGEPDTVLILFCCSRVFATSYNVDDYPVAGVNLEHLDETSTPPMGLPLEAP